MFPSIQAPLTITDRLRAVLSGRQPDRLPFIDRMDFWHRGLAYQGQLPEPYCSMSLPQIHRMLGFGLEDWRYPYSVRYRRVELFQYRNGELTRRETDPLIYDFPSLWDDLPVDRAGEFRTELHTPHGTLTIRHAISEDGLRSGASRAIIKEHPLKSAQDDAAFEFILDHSEIVPLFDEFLLHQAALEGLGYLVPKLARMPFQALLIDIFGEAPLFYTLHDEPGRVERLLYLLHQRMLDLIDRLRGLPVPYIELIDNLEGAMTNPRLFRRYLLPYYQEYAELLHAQGKLLGSHTDGDLKLLVPLLAESGLDVCESFTPAPITSCTFEQAWKVWAHGPLIWGGIPSYYLEPRLPEAEFQAYVEKILSFAWTRPLILGIGDAVMVDNDIQRLAWIAERVEQTPLDWGLPPA